MKVRPEATRRALWFLVLALAFALVSLNAYRLLATRKADPDQFWHVATGRYIVQHGGVPRIDPFSWYGSSRDSHWIAHEWLFGVLAYGLHSLGGFRALYAFTALLDGALFLLSYALALVRSRRQALSLAIATLTIFGTYPNLAPRPQMLTFCLLLVIALLGEKGRLWWSVPIVLLAANLHGAAYPIYLVVLAFYALPAQPLVLAAAAATVLVNPNGTALLSYALGVANPDAGFINEFQPTALVSRPLNVATYTGALILVWGRRFKLKDAVFILAVVLLSFSAIRQVAFFYVLVLPMLAPYIPGRTDEEAEPDRAEVPRLAIAYDVVPVVVLAVAITVTARALPRGAPDVTSGYPAQAAGWIKANHIEHVFNIWGDGGFLIYSGVPPMIDGRGDPYMAAGNHGVDMAHDYLITESLQEDTHSFLNGYGIRHLLLHKGTGLFRALLHDPAIRVVYEDEKYAVLTYAPPAARGASGSVPAAPAGLAPSSAASAPGTASAAP